MEPFVRRDYSALSLIEKLPPQESSLPPVFYVFSASIT